MFAPKPTFLRIVSRLTDTSPHQADALPIAVSRDQQHLSMSNFQNMSFCVFVVSHVFKAWQIAITSA
jgi:hypothetical protein